MYKIIQDTVHGAIKLKGLFMDLISTPELQRLHGIKQLGFCYLAFPGANHTRFEHSLGVGHLALRIAEELELSKDEKRLLIAAGVLHDVGHPPYSHTLEYLLHQLLGVDHMELTKKIVEGEYSITDSERSSIPEILERHGLDVKEVSELVRGPETYSEWTLTPWIFKRKPHKASLPPYLAQIIHSETDADQIDYLLRDAYYTNVAYGVIDKDRLLKSFEIYKNELFISKKGIYAAEGMLLARALMYSAVYFHHTVRTAEIMLSRACEPLIEEKRDEIQKMIDAELFCEMLQTPGYVGEIAKRLKYRRLFKRAYTLRTADLEESQREALSKLSDIHLRRLAEEELARKAGVSEGHVMIDLPMPELLVSEPRIHRTEIMVLDGEPKVLSSFTPIARALRKRKVPDWVLMIFTSRNERKRVSKVAERVLFG
ncbi:MAG: HD domain-containing protein [Candidatus Methanofastidiosia archaeon]